MKQSTQSDRRFWNRIAEKYARDPIADEAAYQRKLEVTREYFTQQSVVLEFGCGTGSTALLHAPHVSRIDAIDLSADMLKIARQRQTEAGVENVQFTETDIGDFSASAGKYDVVLGLSVLHLLRNRADTLGKVHDLLKPGGVFVSSTACLADHMGFIQPVITVGRWIGRMPYVEFFSENRLVQEQEAAGFEIVHRWRPKKNAAVFLVARKRP